MGYHQTIISLFLIFFFSLNTFGQNTKNSIDIAIGSGVSFFYGQNPFDQTSTAFIIKSTYQKNITELFSLATGLYFERKGASVYWDNTDDNIINRYKLDHHFYYSTIPLLTQFTFGSKNKFYGNIGPYVGFLFAQTVTFKSVDSKQREVVNQTSHTNSKRIDFGISAGLGAEFPFSNNKSLTLEIKNNLGLINFDFHSNSDSEQLYMRHNVTYLLVGIKFILDK